MTRFLCLPVFAAALFAQSGDNPFNRPPAKVDEALRERITEFFQDHVDGKFRQAEKLVAEDTQDFFYNANKPRYLSFEIQSIEYSEKFTRARAIVLCEQYVMVPGFMDSPLKVPTPSTWKLENGQWYWYVDMDALRNTPFGRLGPKDGAPAPPPSGKAVSLPSSIPTSPDFALGKVKADKQTLVLKPGESGEVTLSNAAPGVTTVSLYTPVRGIELAPAHADIPAQGKTTLTFKATKDATAATVNLKVEQTGEMIPIQVKVE